jgi:D-alanyl-lipoteichoic acid acyltransferase DltB (MBOAT superfamily)
MDFSAYSDIAIGVGKLFGIRLSQNFKYPLFSVDFADFWRRWHITLSSWFRDYVYIPLGGARKGAWVRFRNIMIVFFLTGVWHGSNDLKGIVLGILFGIFTYGTIHLTQIVSPEKKEIPSNQLIPTFRQIIQMLLVFLLLSFVLIFFKGESLDQSIRFVQRLFSFELFGRPIGFKYFIPIFIVVGIDWFNKHKEHPLNFDYLPAFIRWGIYYLVIFLILKTQVDGSPYLYYQL